MKTKKFLVFGGALRETAYSLIVSAETPKEAREYARDMLDGSGFEGWSASDEATIDMYLSDYVEEVT